jgi:serine/threonine protein phosphatase PrpC
LASDGVWEFISNREVLEIVIPFWEMNNPVKAAEALEKESLQRWRDHNNIYP